MDLTRLAARVLLGSGTLALLACSSSPPSSSASPEPRVVVDLHTAYQTLEGFGASVAWFQGSLTYHPQKAEIYELLFAELGLDILRYRNRYERMDPDDRDLSPEVEILEQATASLGHAPRLMLTSWSPPGPLKANGEESCSGNDDCTLRREDNRFVYAEFADYWYGSLEAYAAEGISPDFVSIQNEPGFIPSAWEGCRFRPTETADYPGYDQALAAVHERLGELDNPPLLVGPETLGIHWGNFQDFASAMDRSLVHALAHHLYESGGDGVWDWKQPGPESYVNEMRDAARAADDLPVFQTEFQTDGDNFIEGGFETAWLIHNSLVHEGVSAFLYWDLVWANSGLVALQEDSFTVRDQYYSLRHYARYTDPGWLRVDATATLANLRVSAYVSPERDQLTVVLLNVGVVDQSLSLETPGLSIAESEVYRTVYDPGASQTWVDLGSLPEDRMLTLPARAVMTVVLRG